MGNAKLTRIKSLLSKTQKLLTAIRKQTAKWRLISTYNDRVDYVLLIEKSRWERLKAVANKKILQRTKELERIWKVEQHIRMLRDSSDQLNVIHAEKNAASEYINAHWRELKPLLASKLKKAKLHSSDINKLLSKAKQPFGESRQQYIDTYIAQKSILVDTNRKWLKQSIMGAILADSIATLNLRPTHSKNKLESTVCKRWIEQSFNNLNISESTLKNALASSQENLILQASEKLSERARTILSWAVQGAAEQSGNRTQKNLASNRLSVQTGDLIRRAIRAISIHLTLQDAMNSADTASLDAWRKAARKLVFQDGSAQEKFTPIQKLEHATRSKNGANASIEGVVQDVKIVTLGRKHLSLSSVRCTDGSTYSVVLPYIKIDSGGMVAGASVKINGIYHQKAAAQHLPKRNKPLAGTEKYLEIDGIVVDRIAYRALSKNSWMAWVNQQIRSIYEPVPHALNASWSWEPGVDGACNQLKYATWYKE